MKQMQATLERANQTRNGPTRYTQAQFNQYIEAHERFLRRAPRAMRAIMRFANAQDIDFSGRDLTEADFTGTHMTGARLVNTRLERANLYCADLREVDARNANFFRADLRGATLRNARLCGANLDEADMRQAVLARSDIEKGIVPAGRSTDRTGGEEIVFSVDFSNCSMKHIKLASARLKGANFSGANLAGADLKGADLSGVRFVNAILTGVELSQARIDPDALAGCVTDPTAEAVARRETLLARLQAAELWIKTNSRQGAAAVLDGEDLRPIAGAFAGRRLTAMSACDCRAIGVSFAAAQLQCARFDFADLRDADFRDADLRGASFRGANLWHARFSGADLRPLPIKGSERAVDLSDAGFADDAFAGALRD